MLNCCVLLGLDWAEPMMLFKFACHMFMHTYLQFFIFLYIDVVGALLLVSLSLSCVSLLYGTQTQIHSILEPSSFWGIFFFPR